MNSNALGLDFRVGVLQKGKGKRKKRKKKVDELLPLIFGIPTVGTHWTKK